MLTLGIALILSATIFYVANWSIIHFFYKKNLVSALYQLKNDMYIHLLALFSLTSALVFYFLPPLADQIHLLSTLQFFMPLTFAVVLYVLFLLEEPLLLHIGLFVLTFANVFMIRNSQNLIFDGSLSYILENIVVAVLLYLFILGVKTLNKVFSVHNLYMLSTFLGLIFLFFASALPFYLALLSCFWVGCFGALSQKNFYTNKININDGAVISSAFILTSFFLYSANELVFSSVYMFMIYPLCELIFSFVERYIFHNKDYLLQSIYSNVLSRDLPLDVLHASLLKLFVLNTLLALFQLYSTNILALPIIAPLINIWLLSKLYHFNEPDQTLKDSGNSFIGDVKKELQEIQQTLKKGNQKK